MSIDRLHASIKGTARSTLGKRKELNLGNASPCSLSMSINAQARSMATDYQLSANCWLRDSSGREIGFVLNHAVLLTMHAELGRMIADLRIES